MYPVAHKRGRLFVRLATAWRVLPFPALTLLMWFMLGFKGLRVFRSFVAQAFTAFSAI
jgi:hypothetical protein